jgi:hypothetical protein
MLSLFMACLSPSPVDTGPSDTSNEETADTDTAETDSPADTWESLCPGGISGAVEGGFSGDGQFLLLRTDYGAWSDGCYGGRIDPPHEAVDGAFDWPAEFYVGAGSPVPRPIRAVGCAASDHLELAIVEEDGTVFWGPWTMTADPTVESITTCD